MCVWVNLLFVGFTTSYDIISIVSDFRWKLMDGIELYFAWASRVGGKMGQISTPAFFTLITGFANGLHGGDIPHPRPLFLGELKKDWLKAPNKVPGVGNCKFPGIEVGGAGAVTVLMVASCYVGANCTTDKTRSGSLSSYSVHRFLPLNIF